MKHEGVTMVVTADDGQGNWSAQDTRSAVLDRLRDGPQPTLALRKAFRIGAGEAGRRFAGELAKMQREGIIAFDHASRTWSRTASY